MNGGDVSYREHSRTSSTDEDFDSQKLNKEQVEMKMYGQLWPILLIVALVLIAMPNVSAAQEEDVIEANRALALRYADLRAAKFPTDTDWKEIFSEDAVGHVWQGQGDQPYEAYVFNEHQILKGMQPYHSSDCQAWANEAYAAVSCYLSGKFAEEAMGIMPNNAEWGINNITFLSITDGKIIEFWECENTLSLLQQLGLADIPEGVTPAPEPQWTITDGETVAAPDEVTTSVFNWVEALNTHQLSDLEDLAANGFVLHDILAGDLDVPNYQDYMTVNQTSLEEWSLTTDEPYFVEAGLFFGLATVTGVFTQDLNSIPANGNLITLPIFTVARIQNGKAVEMWSWYDSFGFISQLTAPPAE